MSDLPTGTLTLLFTDIEGSTAILARLGERYAEVITTQRAILRDAFSRHHGHELGTEGDSFFVVFRSVHDALAAVRDAQQRLTATAWPDDVVVRVRMGLHTGEPTPHDDGYVGMDVHRAARVAASAHGGQVVVTESTFRIAAAGGVAGLEFDDLGRHRLKDLGRPEHLYQVTVRGAPSRFPPLRSLGSASNLPLPATSLVGRQDELAQVTGLLGSHGARLVTLTGPGGTGKTRLALAVAQAVDDGFRDGVYFVPLAPVTSADDMWTTIADVLGVTGESKAPPTFLEYLAARQMLLVLDNLEHLPEAADVVAEVLERSPQVQVLATSRRPLHVSGEHEVLVEPLAVPGPGEAEQGSAVELFVERARLVNAGFRLTADNAQDVRAICAGLDGLPLAIELVAARAKLLGPRALHARLDRALEMSRAAVDAPGRQQTLRSTIDWSYRLLPPDQQQAFRRLAACDGEIDLDAAAAVIGANGPDVDDALDVIGELVDASLLAVREGSDGEPRLRLLHTVARYAAELLDADPDSPAVRRRHAEHYLDVARAASRQLRAEQHLAGRDRLERELPNLRAALRWALGAPDGDRRPATTDDRPDARLTIGLQLCEQLSWFWYACGYPAEGRRWLEAAVTAAGGRRSREAMTALHALGVLVLQQGDAARAKDLFEACLPYWRETEDRPRLTSELNSLGLAWRAVGEPDRARPLLEEAVAVARDGGEKRREVNALSNLALLAIDAHRSDEAITLLQRCLELDTELQDTWGQAADHLNLASAMLRADRVDEAHEDLRRNAATTIALGDIEMTVDVLDLFAVVFARRGDAERAARLVGATTRMRQESETPLGGPDSEWFESVLAPVRGLPDAATWQGNVDAGSRLSVEEALAVALAG